MEGAALRGQASRIAKSHEVMALLAWAKAGGAGPSDVEGDPRELKKILWRHARSSDAQRSIRAAEVLNKLTEAERERAGPVETRAPEEFLDTMLADDAAGPAMAAIAAVHYELCYTVPHYGRPVWLLPETNIPGVLKGAPADRAFRATNGRSVARRIVEKRQQA